MSFRAYYLNILLMGFVCGSSHAIVISHSGELNIPIPIDFDGVYIELTNELDAAAYRPDTSQLADWDFNPFFGGAAFGSSDTFLPVLESATTNADILNLNFGDTVSSSSNFPTGFSGSSGHMGTGTFEFESGTSGYLGFSLIGSSDTYYGWMRLTLQNERTVGVIHEWAWDTDGDSITVGAVPEMSNTALLIGLGAGLWIGARRRIRRHKLNAIGHVTLSDVS